MVNRSRSSRGVILALMGMSLLVAVTSCSSNAGSSSNSSAPAAAANTAAASAEAPAPSSAPACARQYTIGFAHPIGEAGFVKALKARVQEIADANGCITLLMDNTTGNNLEAQRATLESWITQKVDAIVTLPVDGAALASLQTKAQADGIKWLTYAYKGEGTDGSTGFDSDASGTAAAAYLTEWVDKNYPDHSGITAEITTLTALEAIAGGRWKKPIEALDKLGIKVVSLQDCADQTCGLQITEDTLRANPDLRIVVGLNDDAALGAAKAFMNAGIDPAKVLVIGQDGNPEALAAIKAGGPMKASIGIDLESLAQAIVQNPMNAIDGKQPTDSSAGVLIFSVDDQAGLDKAIAQMGS